MTANETLKRREIAKTDNEGTLAEAAYSRLEEMIILGTLCPGVRLSEQMLAQTLKLGRTPIREALQKLKQNNLVEILPKSGVFVTRMDSRSQWLVFEVRRALEPLVAGRAARRATADQKLRFLRLAEEMRASADAGNKLWVMNVDRQFKNLVVSASKNRYLAGALVPIFAHSRRFYFTHLETTDIGIARVHSAVIDAIGRGDEEAAVERTHAFLHEIEAFTKAIITAELAAM